MRFVKKLYLLFTLLFVFIVLFAQENTEKYLNQKLSVDFIQIEEVEKEDTLSFYKEDSLNNININKSSGEEKKIVQFVGDWSSLSSEDVNNKKTASGKNDTIKIGAGAKDFNGLWQYKTQRVLMKENFNIQ